MEQLLELEGKYKVKDLIPLLSGLVKQMEDNVAVTMCTNGRLQVGNQPPIDEVRP